MAGRVYRKDIYWFFLKPSADSNRIFAKTIAESKEQAWNNFWHRRNSIPEITPLSTIDGFFVRRAELVLAKEIPLKKKIKISKVSQVEFQF